MTFVPVVPSSGLTGFRFVQKTYDNQLSKFVKSPEVKREIEYFESKAGAVKTTEDLISDRRLLAVVLGAFGLDDEIGKKAFIRKVIDDGTINPGSLANRLADPAFREMSSFLGFGDLGATLNLKVTRDALIDRYRTRQFERAVGDVDVDVRLSLNFEREITEIAKSSSVDTAGWFRVLGNQALRKVVEGAYNLPTSFARIDVDQQRGVLEERTKKLFGTESPKAFEDPKNVDKLLRRFLVNAQIDSGQTSTGTRGAAALTLLQFSGLGQGATSNLFASRV